jgi:hypothetical protein
MPIPLGIFATAGAGGGATSSFDLISSTILTGSQSSVTFSSIPSTYKHLQLRMLPRSDRNFYDGGKITFNGDSGANYAIHNLAGNGSSAFSEAYSSNTYLRLEDISGTNDGVSNAFSAHIMDILDFSSTAKNKTTRMLQTANLSLNKRIWLSSGAWLSTSAITSITIAPTTGPNFITGSRFSLYGIKG